MNAGMGAGIGMAMAGQMMTPQVGPWGQMGGQMGGQVMVPPAAPQSAALPPPPPPVEKVWHLAEGGLTKGPFSRAALGRMAQEAEISRETLVWTAGQDGWKSADEVPELAQLFTVQPPPPPAA